MYQGRQNTTHRPVSFLLGLGILLAPYIFSWFTLREGHSTVARLVSFGWLLIIMGAFSSPEDTNLYSSSDHQNSFNLTQKRPWIIAQYNDEFGDPTGDRYMVYNPYTKGNFSNSAATNSTMYASFIIDLDNRISILLCEYYKGNLVKEYRNINYFVKIKTASGKQSLLGTHLGSRLLLNQESSTILHRHFMNSRPVKFYITKDSKYDTLTSYRFSFNDFHGYKDTYRELKGIIKDKSESQKIDL